MASQACGVDAALTKRLGEATLQQEDFLGRRDGSGGGRCYHFAANPLIRLMSRRPLAETHMYPCHIDNQVEATSAAAIC